MLHQEETMLVFTISPGTAGTREDNKTTVQCTVYNMWLSSEMKRLLEREKWSIQNKSIKYTTFQFYSSFQFRVNVIKY